MGSGLEIAVVGAGAVGATTAYELVRRGADVTLYEREAVASGASGRAAGICYDAFTDPLDAELANDAIERFRTLSDEETFSFRECPYVWFVRNDDEQADAIRSGIDRMQQNGVIALEMDADELGTRFPALQTEDVSVAGIAGAAGYTDPSKYTAAVVDGATELGATVSETEVEVRTAPPRIVPANRTEGGDDGGEFDAVVVAAGARTKRLLENAGIPIAMKPYRVQALIADIDLEEPMYYDVSAESYLRPHPEGVLVGDGTELSEADPASYDRSPTPEFVDAARERLNHRLEHDGIEIDRGWAGLCTATPDRDPLVGECRNGLYVATGFQGHGFMRAPAIGKRLALQVLGEEGIERFDPDRFDGDEQFEIRAMTCGEGTPS